jgi:hypothetical protein
VLRGRLAVVFLTLALSGAAGVRAELVTSLQIDPTRSFAHPRGSSETYAINGWLQLQQYDSLYPLSVANAFIKPLSLHTDSPFGPFSFINGWGQILEDDSADFSGNPCAFFLAGSCWVAGPVFFGAASGTFDGTTLFLEGSEAQLMGFPPPTDYTFTIYATAAALPSAVVPEPSTLPLIGLGGMLYTLIRKRFGRGISKYTRFVRLRHCRRRQIRFCSC